MARGPSWRLVFIDIDSSYSITTDTGIICTYSVIRAPSGNVEPMYFPAGNTEALYATFGVGTADWPDIDQVVAVNNNYGTFVSAPAGSSEEYPSYYGGVYLTTKGKFDFYHVSDKSAPNFLTDIAVGNEFRFDENIKPEDGSILEVVMQESIDPENDPKKLTQGGIKISNIPEAVMLKMNNFEFNYWGNGAICPAGYYTYVIDTDTLPAGKSGAYASIFCLDEDGIPVKKNGSNVVCGHVVGGMGAGGKLSYTIMIGGASDVATNDATTNVPYIDFTLPTFGIPVLKKLYDKDEVAGYIQVTTLEESYADENNIIKVYTQVGSALSSPYNFEYSTATNEWTATTEAGTTLKLEDLLEAGPAYIYVENGSKPEDFLSVIVNGNDGSATYTMKGITKSIGKSVTGIQSRIRELVSIKDITYQYIVQKSPTEKVTHLTIDSIGYDQYRYDTTLPWAYLPEGVKPEDVFSLTLDGTLSKPSGFTFMGVTIDDNDNVTAEIKTLVYRTELDENDLPKTVFSFEAADIADYLTKTVKLTGKTLYEIPEHDASELTSTIWYVMSKTKVLQQTEDGVYPLALVKDINFNTTTLTCTQEVYPGSQTNGLFNMQGSLDEEGVNSSGQNIYWLNALPEDSLSFVDVVPVDTFNKYCDTKGSYTAKRIADGTKITLKGQRYITKVVNDNIAAGVNGCAANDGLFIPAVKQGWNYMMTDTKLYDDAYVAFDCTGYEDLKPLLLSCRDTFKLTTFISPKTISDAEFKNPSQVTVSGRGTGTAQYVGEFMQKDPYTGKKFWMRPIGYVALMLCKIIDLRLGGAAPMWENDSMGLGGQLAVNVLKARWPFNDAAEKVFDSKGLNPIIYSASTGVMITSQRTTMDPTNETDWSFLGHSMAFDLCKRAIRDNVMRPQIGKLNSPFYQEMRHRQTAAILDERTTGSNSIWAAYEVEVEKVNTTLVKMKREFAIYVRVQVRPFAEKTVLTFENTAQGTLVS